MISLTCPKCAKALTAPNEAAGRDGRCSCGAVFPIPSPRLRPVPASDSTTDSAASDFDLRTTGERQTLPSSAPWLVVRQPTA